MPCCWATKCGDRKGTGTNIMSTRIPEAASLITTTSYRLLPPATGSGPPPSPPAPLGSGSITISALQGTPGGGLHNAHEFPKYTFFFFLRLRGETNGRKTSCWSLSRVWNCLMHQFPHLKTEMTMVPSVLRFNEVKYVNQSLNQSLVQKWIGVIINNNYNIIILLLSCNNNNIMSDTRTWWCGIKTKAHLWCYQMSWWKKTKKVIKKKKKKENQESDQYLCHNTSHTDVHTVSKLCPEFKVQSTLPPPRSQSLLPTDTHPQPPTLPPKCP